MQEKNQPNHNNTYELNGSVGANQYTSNYVQTSMNIEMPKGRCLEYQVSKLETTPLTSDEFLQAQNQILIINRILQVLEVEAPVTESY